MCVCVWEDLSMRLELHVDPRSLYYQVFKEYFKEVEEESIRDNFVIVYELLDEVMDFGFPQTVEAKVLQEYITQEYHQLDKSLVKISAAVTGPVNWRSENIFYPKNECFLDVVESVNLLVSSTGAVLRSEVLGALKMRCFLSGMPRLKVGFNDRILGAAAGGGSSSSGRPRAVDLEDMVFHQCVRHQNTLTTNRSISFVPPDGEFDLMTYRLSSRVKPLIVVTSHRDTSKKSSVTFLVKAKSQFKVRSTANNVEIVIPVRSDADTPRFQTNVGSVHYAPEMDAIVWTIRNFPGNQEFMMRAKFGLPSVPDPEDNSLRRPIRVNFEIPYFTVSGLQVRYLKVSEASGYQSSPWVRYITVSGDYEIRLHN